MNKGDRIEILIEDMSFEGQGIGRWEGIVVFVPHTVPGDKALAEITKVKKNYCFSRLVEIIEESPDRIDEFDCESCDKGCGGCVYSKLSYEGQLKLKEHQVREKIARLGGIEDPLIRPIIGMNEDDNEGMGPYRYRNKAQFPVSTGGIITRKGGIVENLGEPAVGFYKNKSHQVVDCPDCYIQSMAAMAAADALRTFMEEDNITAWDPKWEKGLIRHLIVKTGFMTKAVMVILVINGKGIPNAQKLVEMLDDAVYEAGYNLESVAININKEANSKEIMGDDTQIIAGSNVISDMIGDLTFEISPTSFYQVNPVQVTRLYDTVHRYCEFDSYAEPPVIMDLYCGVGTIGLYCADKAEAVVGIEVVKDAVVNANRNAVVNSIVNARFIQGKAEEILPEYISGNNSSDEQLTDQLRRSRIAIMDPPRAGSKPELLDAIAESNVDRIIYVSCDPATLGRDIKYLESIRFEFCEATPVDMFPWTGHVETVCLLSRKDK
ncbi:MAG: 23S rRNA (uracil(1939)-C(5))-methyltransferase RlmD [Bacillota bacterium]|nr:23S rRNA (uracil(1939)-C(5))-methyltransferase RlmD [Bacillota bacterium]